MKFKNLFFILALFTSSAAYAAPYAIINSNFVVQGCHYWKISVWDDMGTPHDTSDDTLMATDTMNDCDDQPGTDGGDPNNPPVHAVVNEDYTLENDLGETCSFFVVSILDGNELKLAEKAIFGGCE